MSNPENAMLRRLVKEYGGLAVLSTFVKEVKELLTAEKDKRSLVERLRSQAAYYSSTEEMSNVLIEAAEEIGNLRESIKAIRTETHKVVGDGR